MAAAKAGYWVESFSCDVFRAPKNVKSGVEELGWAYQIGHASGTRPDIVLYWGDQVVAWIDITSSFQQNHIAKKSGTKWLTVPYVTEVVYESFDMGALLTQLQAIGGSQNAPATTGDLDAALKEYEKRKDALQAKRAEWAAAIQMVTDRVNGRTNPPTRRQRETGTSPRTKAMVAVVRKLCGADLEPKQVAGIISFSQLVPQNSGFKSAGSGETGRALVSAKDVPTEAEIDAAVDEVFPDVEMTDADK
jgi:hypothetical protein